ncbi:C-type lectin domain family 4 member K-like [Dromiciops gliroides]|uniref:C-type lectin domain family 4 member K-like n=1 Tax=Dromiciops gliroides TaxID=33562 RepID=UPI001CC7E993|nr:C-type lectin domain family 4 member K-like [Dromiciops gliroides]
MGHLPQSPVPRERESRMNIDDYENISLGKPSPWPLGQFLRIEPHSTQRTPRMAQVALVLLTLALLASLTAIIILYFQIETCIGSEEVQQKACLDNITTLTSEMQMLSHGENPRLQTLETKKPRSGLEDVTASSAIMERLKGHLETITILPVSIHQVQMGPSGVDPETTESPVEKVLKFGKFTEPPGGPTGEALEIGGVTETPGVHVEKVSATVEIQTDLKMLKDLLEAVNASYFAVREEYRTILTLLSKGGKFYNGNLYYFSQKKTSWYEAEKFCESWGSHLTSVASVEEQEFLIKRAKGISYWIGLTKQGTEGSWHWVDGTPYSETSSRRFWIEGQSQPQKVRDRCVEIQVKALSSWNDRDCQDPLQGLCKKALRRFEDLL